jgi:hypothetical protein
MRESRTYGFVRGADSDMRPYRDRDLRHANAYEVGFSVTRPAARTQGGSEFYKIQAIQLRNQS